MKYETKILDGGEQNILDNILGKGFICKNDEEKNFPSNRVEIHINFIDHYADILKYKEPIKRYFNRIENTIDKDN